MKVLGVDGSGRTGGNTGVLVSGFLRGAEEAGAETTFAELGPLSIRGCTACKACKSTREKVCVIQDDMQPFYEMFSETDVIFLASPIYLDHITAQLMTFIQRTYCYLSPSIENHWPRSNVCFVAGITYGAGSPTAYDYVLDWMRDRMDYYYSIPTVATLKVPACSHVNVIPPGHPEVRRAHDVAKQLCGQ